MSIIEKTVQWAVGIAADNSHGYSQQTRWGPSYDCSSLVISAWRQAGIALPGATYTGNMRPAMTEAGFQDVTREVDLFSGAGLRRGDVLLNIVNHTALYIGGGEIVHARSSEGTTDTVDGSGNEIRVQGYYNYPWNCVLRYIGPVEDGEEIASGLLDDEEIELPAVRYDIGLPEIKYGAAGELVRAVQALLILRKCPCGVDGADGDFGPATRQAVINYQIAHGLDADGIVGRETFNSLIFNK